jgi:hypothetical protein
VLALVAAAGVLLVALADTAARDGEGSRWLMFWGGLGLIYGPIMYRLLGRAAQRPERLVLVLVLGTASFFAYCVRSPLQFVGFDEVGWWRATHDIIVTGHAFHHNPLNPSTAGFPALAIVTAALSQLTGLSIFASGLIVIGAARAVLMLALFLLLERVTGSSRGAGVGVGVYACNPSFLYFDTQFAYESLALALALVYLLASLRWSRLERQAPVQTAGSTFALLVLLACGLTVTHHMTGLATFAFMTLWCAANFLVSRRGAADAATRAPYVPTVLLGAAVAIWLATVAGSVTLAELGGVFTRAYREISDLVLGQSGAKQLFSGSGQHESGPGRLLAALSVAATLAIVPAGLWSLWRGRVRQPLWWALAAAAALYPFTIALRFTQASSEISQRASEFVFVGVAFLAAVLVARWGRRSIARGTALGATGALAGVATLCFLGGFILGELRATREPGPYLVGADARSVTPEGNAAAAFAATNISRGSRLLADRTDDMLLGSYGGLDPVFGRFEGVKLPRILFSDRFDAADRRALRGQAIALVVVDRRLSRSLPLIGYYVESDEPGAFVRTQPVSRLALEKFDSVPGVSRIYTNGPIAVYATSRLLR